MNFGRAKTILIFIFAIVNLFLVGYIFVTSYDITTPDNITVEKTISILKKRNVFLDKNVKLTKADNINYLNLKGITTDENVIASKLLGSYIKKSGKYFGDFGDLTITNGEFEWNVKDSHTFKEFNEKSVVRYAEKFLKDHQIDTSDLRPESVSLNDGNYEIEFHHHFFDKELFNVKTTVFVSGGGVYKVLGRIFTLDSLSESEKFTNNPINVLLNYSAEKDKSKKVEILAVNPGYYTENNPGEFKSLSVQPCFELVLKSGESIYFDAVSAKMIKQAQN